eukprot:15451744-Alexandrium_andersonii.AAC.1
MWKSLQPLRARRAKRPCPTLGMGGMRGPGDFGAARQGLRAASPRPRAATEGSSFPPIPSVGQG